MSEHLKAPKRLWCDDEWCPSKPWCAHHFRKHWNSTEEPMGWAAGLREPGERQCEHFVEMWHGDNLPGQSAPGAEKEGVKWTSMTILRLPFAT